MTNFQKTLSEDRRLSLLIVLNDSPGYSANAYLLQSAIAGLFGHQASTDQVIGELSWLSEAGLIDTRETGGVTLATLTARGVDVALGRATHPGVKRPMPS